MDRMDRRVCRHAAGYGRPAICGVHSICIWIAAKESWEMPALSHVGTRNPGDATCRWI